MSTTVAAVLGFDAIMTTRRRLRHASVQVAIAVALAVVVSGLTAAPAQAAYSNQPLPGWVPNGTVYALAVSGDTVYIGGRFTFLRNPQTGQTVARNRLAAFDAGTGALRSWAPSADDTVRTLTVSTGGDMVFVGGLFASINGATRPNLAAVDASTGARVRGWEGSASGSVRDLVVQGSRLYVGGTYSRLNGAARFGLAALEASSGRLVNGWAPRIVGGRPRALTLAPDGRSLALGGNFTEIDGAPRMFLGSVSVASGDVTGWAPQAVCGNCYVFDLAAGGGSVYAGVGGGGGGRAVAWDAASAVRQWLVRGDGNVQAIATDGELVYAGGHFAPGFDGASRNQLAAVDAVTGDLDRDFAPDLGTSSYPGVWALVAADDQLLVGGGFRSVESTPQARFARFPVR